MVFVISKTGKPLMPTSEYRARKLLKGGKAAIYTHKPFTIQLTGRMDGYTQPVEYCCDTGYQHIGISIKSEAREYVNEQRDLLKNETEKHRDRRAYRRERRNRLRYRKPRFSNRRGMICRDGFAPSIRNKRDVHVRLYRMYAKVCPITSAIFEMGQFDTQVLKAVERGVPLPQGTDYQCGERYGYATLREAVFGRDGYTCQICRKNAVKDNAVLRIHHIGFWQMDRTNRMDNLLTVCAGCHTPKNHRPGGKLYGLRPRLKTFTGATFMTQVRWDMLKRIKEISPDTQVCVTYGAATKLARRDVNVKKSHSNDAFCMGTFRPGHRTDFRHYAKQRRNNRILCKFYDAKYTDIRDGSVKGGRDLYNGRTNRNHKTDTENLHKYRGEKVSRGRRSIRRNHYSLRPGDLILCMGEKQAVKGVTDNGKRLQLANGKTAQVRNVTLLRHCGAWRTLPQFA